MSLTLSAAIKLSQHSRDSFWRLCSMGESDVETDDEFPQISEMRNKLGVPARCGLPVATTARSDGTATTAAAPTATAAASAAAGAVPAITCAAINAAADSAAAAARAAGVSAPLVGRPQASASGVAAAGAADVTPQVGCTHFVACQSREERAEAAFKSQPQADRGRLVRGVYEKLAANEVQQQMHHVRTVAGLLWASFDTKAPDPRERVLAFKSCANVEDAVTAAVLANTGHEGAGQSDAHGADAEVAFESGMIGAFTLADGATVHVTREEVQRLWAAVPGDQVPGMLLCRAWIRARCNFVVML